MARKIRSDKGKTHRKYEDAIYREMARKGQVFILFNRLEFIEEKILRQEILCFLSILLVVAWALRYAAT